MSKDKKKLEILITVPVLNNLVYTKKALNSIKTVSPYALFLVDNGSVDDTAEYFKSLAKFPNVYSLVLKENMGAAGSWNEAIQFGIQKLKVDKVVILNNDIILNPATLDFMLQTLEIPDVGLCSAKNVSGKIADASDILKIKAPTKPYLTETPDFSCFAIKKECVRRVGFFDEIFYPAYFEDNDYHYRMRLDGLKAVCDHRAIYFHYGSRTKTIDPDFKIFLDECYLKNQKTYLEKWGGDPGKEKFEKPFNGKPPKNIEIPIMKFKKGTD